MPLPVSRRCAAGRGAVNLSNEAGDVTSHIQGFLSRTVKLLELGIKPVYVFDGKPPEIKSQTLAARGEAKRQAEEDYSAALEQGDAEEIRRPRIAPRARRLR